MFGPLICKPGSSRKNKTGSWRMESRPNFLKKNCAGCKLCVSVCPESCITETEKNAFEVDMSYCKGCGLCAVVCPKKDIEMVKEETAEKTK
ncbi:MAG: 4Fe-4S dicluster domain-containing protein [Candidatus Omnitrophica bacterium]|nr:4Fe-4S dicluster domain-containing protein [Candidatus Omnitrophota bacterium]